MKEASNGLSLLFMVGRWHRMAFLINIIYTSFFTGKLNEVCNILDTIIGSDKGLAPTSRQAIVWNKSVCYDIIIKSEKKGNIRRPIFALYPTQWCIQTQWPVWRKARESMRFQLIASSGVACQTCFSGSVPVCLYLIPICRVLRHIAWRHHRQLGGKMALLEWHP